MASVLSKLVLWASALWMSCQSYCAQTWSWTTAQLLPPLPLMLQLQLLPLL